jgi:hypothetical protein
MKLPICSSIAKTLALGTLTASVMFAAKPAEAAIFNVGGTNYDITTVQGTYNDISSQINATPWWGSRTKAVEFASAVYHGLGLQLDGQLVSAPLFAYDLWSGTDRVSFWFGSILT